MPVCLTSNKRMIEWKIYRAKCITESRDTLASTILWNSE